MKLRFFNCLKLSLKYFLKLFSKKHFSFKIILENLNYKWWGGGLWKNFAPPRIKIFYSSPIFFKLAEMFAKIFLWNFFQVVKFTASSPELLVKQKFPPHHFKFPVGCKKLYCYISYGSSVVAQSNLLLQKKVTDFSKNICTKSNFFTSYNF
jgi:hypothetical protein